MRRSRVPHANRSPESGPRDTGPAECDGHGDRGSGESGIPDTRSVQDLIAALRSLGYPTSEARLRVDRATAKLGFAPECAQVSEEAVLAEALRA